MVRPTVAQLAPWGPGAVVDLVVVHSISLPPDNTALAPVQQLFTNALELGLPSLLPANQRPCVLHFSLSATVGSAICRLVTSAPARWPVFYRGRTNCNDDSIGIELKALEGSGRLSPPNTKPWGASRDLIERYPCTMWQDTNTSPQAANKTPAPASTGQSWAANCL